MKQERKANQRGIQCKEVDISRRENYEVEWKFGELDLWESWVGKSKAYRKEISIYLEETGSDLHLKSKIKT